MDVKIVIKLEVIAEKKKDCSRFFIKKLNTGMPIVYKTTR